MRQKGLVPDLITYSAASGAREKTKQPDKALELLAEMQRIGLAPYVITRNATISACERAGSLTKQ